MSESMQAGRELDALIAEKVRGYEWRRFEYPPAGGRSREVKPWKWLSRRAHGFDIQGDEERYIENVEHYSTDIAAAWLVVETVCERGFHAVLKTPFTADAPFVAGFTPLGMTGWNGRPDHCAVAASLPHAICLAALLAVANS